MTYEEAVGVIAEETNDAHDERCFETGNCDVEYQARKARRRIESEPQLRGTSADEVLRRTKRVDAAETTILDHLKRYDAEQIAPANRPRTRT